MDKLEIYKNIKTIADELCKENKTYLRADLAFELKKYGIASDSSEVSKLVFDAYRYFHDNSNIAIAFVSNKESRIPSPIQISIIASVLRPNVPNTPILSVDQPQN